MFLISAFFFGGAKFNHVEASQEADGAIYILWYHLLFMAASREILQGILFVTTRSMCAETSTYRATQNHEITRVPQSRAVQHMMTPTVFHGRSPYSYLLVPLCPPLRLKRCFPVSLAFFGTLLLASSLPAQVLESADGLRFALRASTVTSDADDFLEMSIYHQHVLQPLI